MASHSNNVASAHPIPLRILFLHGFTQNPHLFRAKTAALAKALSKAFPTPKYAIHLSYPTAPHKLSLADIPGHTPAAQDDPTSEGPESWGWWRRKDYDASGLEVDRGPSNDGRRDGIARKVIYVGLEQGLEAIAECIRQEGPFDGVVGFSQGAAAAAMVASLLEGEARRAAFRDLEAAAAAASGKDGIDYPEGFLGSVGGGFVQSPFRFAVLYSGFRAPGDRYRAFYEPRIRTPILHVLGQLDVVVEENRGRDLVAVCERGGERVVVHPGGHFVPSQRPWLDAVVGFVKDCVEDGDSGRSHQGGKQEESVEDMDVPF